MRKGKIISLATRGLSSQWRSFLVVLAGAAVLGFAAPQQTQKQAELLLIEAINKELVEGDLQQAIELYKQVISKFSSERPVVARALLRLGEGYEKLGQPEAREAYETVLREYAEQAEQASTARTRLAALRPSPAEADASSLTIRRVWGGPSVDLEGGVSPDGSYLSFVDWSTGDLAVRDLATGTNRRLTNTGGWDQGADYAVWSKPSPDGRQIAYTWFATSEDSVDLRIIGLDGSPPRVLYANEELVYPRPEAWSPNGEELLATFARKDRINQIALISVKDGSVRILKTLDWRQVAGMSLSPDGRYIAYAFPPQEDSPKHDIFVLATNGSRETVVVEHPADDAGPVWTPDGRHLFFTSDRTGTTDAWVVRVADGQPQGSPELLKRDVGRSVSLGFTRDGKYYYGVGRRTQYLYTAELDPQAGGVVASPTAAIERFPGSNGLPAWSPDGKSLAYLSLRSSLPVGPVDPPITLCIRSLETGEEREYSLGLTSEGYLFLHWSPDGRWLLVKAVDRKKGTGLYQIEAHTGEVTLIRHFSDEDNFQWFGDAAFLPDSRSILYTYTQKSTQTSPILRRDLESGEEEVVRTFDGIIPSIALSPDGRRLALIRARSPWGDASEAEGTTLELMSSGGGASRELLKTQDYFEGISSFPGALTWSPNGRELLFVKGAYFDLEKPAGLWQISADGGEPQRLGIEMLGLRDIDLHPDGRRIAFTGGSKWASEVWVMENLLSELEDSSEQ